MQSPLRGSHIMLMDERSTGFSKVRRIISVLLFIMVLLCTNTPFDSEASLEETKNLVRKKLRLPPKIDVQLEQIRDGKLIDLEDGTSML